MGKAFALSKKFLKNNNFSTDFRLDKNQSTPTVFKTFYLCNIFIYQLQILTQAIYKELEAPDRSKIPVLQTFSFIYPLIGFKKSK